MKYLLPFFCISLLSELGAQLHDNMPMVRSAELMHIDFRANPPDIITKGLGFPPFICNATFSNRDGDLQYYTNCMHIFDKNDNIVENGDSINVGYFFSFGVINALRGGFFLPAPGDSTRSYFIYMYPEKYPGVWPLPVQVRYALLDNEANNGLGKVLEKDVSVLDGGLELNFNHACAARHANGRDWWILIPNRMKPIYYRILLTPDGFSSPEAQEIGQIPPTDDPNLYLSWSTFSPDGHRFAQFEIRTGIIQHYHFDRCTGLLSNPDTVVLSEIFQLPDIIYQSLGIAFSPSGKLLYIKYGLSGMHRIFQYDLEAPDIGMSVDTIFFCSTGSTYVCGSSDLLLALNNKIYVHALAVDTNSYHVIHKPDVTGQGCGFEYGGLTFPVKYPNSPMAYYPHYRLGPIDGSPCDTLGLDNHPVAAFLWDSVQLEVAFTNNSYYGPEDFFWDFGDGATSSETGPVHLYGAPGTYYTCLTASNIYSSDTSCQWVTVSQPDTATALTYTPPPGQGAVSIVPNPASGDVRIILRRPLPGPASWSLHDALGRAVRRAVLPPGQKETGAGLSDLPPGLYFWRAEQEGRLLVSGKIILQK